MAGETGKTPEKDQAIEIKQVPMEGVCGGY
jgi:hypothetical protein